MAEKQSYPTFSEKNWWVLRRQLKKSVPSSVTADYLQSIFGLTSKEAANTNLSSLKRLGILDDDGKPTQLANEWRLDESYKSACDKMFKKIYPDDLIDLFSGENNDKNKVKNWFMTRNGIGSNAAGQMMALFLLLITGEIKDTKINQAKSINKKQIKKSPERASIVNGDMPEQEHASVTDFSNDPKRFHYADNGPNLHIDLQIHISAESTPELIETIFASMAKHLYGFDKS